MKSAAALADGPIKLALKLAGRPIPDEKAGPITWDVWMRKNTQFREFMRLGNL